MAQTWFTLIPFEMIEGRRPAIFEAFDSLQLRIKNAFDDTSDAVTAAIFGIDGAVDTYAELPDPATLEVKTIYIVRQKAGAPSGNGLYWVRLALGVHVWEFLDALNMQDADEVPYDNSVSAIPAMDVQGAIDWLKDNGGGSPYIIYTKTLDAADILNKWFVLPSTPATLTDNLVIVKGAPGVTTGIDYSMDLVNDRLIWTGLGFDGIVEAGDVVTVMYMEEN
jgi:hypothetical protein